MFDQFIIDYFTSSFVIRAFIASIAIAVVAGFLGCFIMWRRMAYFGDSIAHSALFGVALGLILSVNMSMMILFACILFAVLLFWLESRGLFSSDMILGILSHGILAVTIVLISLLEFPTFDLHGYLFGNILTVSNDDIYWVYSIGVLVIGLMIWRWHSLILMMIDEDLARIEGVNITLHRLLLISVMAMLMAIAIQIIGVLLVISLLIIPAASARIVSSSPEMTVIFSIIFALIATIIGIIITVLYDIPAGAGIVCVAFFNFIIIYFVRIFKN